MLEGGQTYGTFATAKNTFQM